MHDTTFAACTSKPTQLRTLLTVGSSYAAVGPPRRCQLRGYSTPPRSRGRPASFYNAGQTSTPIGSSPSSSLLTAEWEAKPAAEALAIIPMPRQCSCLTRLTPLGSARACAALRGKPVLPANVTVWEAFRLCGRDVTTAGLGSLFAPPAA